MARRLRRPTALVASAELAAFVQNCFRSLGLSQEDAAAVAEVLVDANLRGVESHGFSRLPAYMRRVRAGRGGGSHEMVVAARSGPLCRLDARSALGPPAALRATDLAIKGATERGLSLVAVANSSHFGSAGFYARRAARLGFLSVVATNGPASMAPYGASEPFLGTNALAISVPLAGRGEFVLDMSCSVAARGTLLRAKELGEPIAEGLAIDAHGEPTTDPAAALVGALLPLGGPKGSGLAFAISLLVGILADAGFDHEAVPANGDIDGPQNLGHLFLVCDPWRVAEREPTLRRLEELVDRLHALRRADGFEDVLFAGERGDRERERRLAIGIPVEQAEIDAAARACDEAGLPELAERARSLPSSGLR